MKAFQPRLLNPESGQFRLGMAVLGAIVSAILHGVALQLPWPLEKKPPLPVSVDFKEPETVDFTVLPSGTLEALGTDDAAAAEAEGKVEGVLGSGAARTDNAPPQTEAAFQDPPPPLGPEPVPEETPPEVPEPALEPTARPLVFSVEPEADPLENLLPVADGKDPVSSPSPTPSSNTSTPTEPTLEERLQNREFYIFNEKPVGNIAFLGSWQNDPSSFKPDDYDLDGTLKIPYELGDHCLETAPQNSAVIIVLDTEGKRLYPAEMNGSTGYDDLDEKALKLVEAKAAEPGFHETGEVVVYALQIEIEGYPDSCP